MWSYIDVKQHRSDGPAMPDVSLHCVTKTRTLADRWKEAREAAGLRMNELDRLIGQRSGYTTRLEKGEKLEPAVGIVAAAAREMRVSLAWLVDGEGPMVRSADSPDLPASGFLGKVRRLPGLEVWIESQQKLTLSQLVKGMAVYDAVKPRSRSDGQPLTGWDKFFEDALTGRATRTLPGAQAEGEAAEQQQMSPTGRKRLRSASKNA